MAIKIQGTTIVDDSQNLTITGSATFSGTGALKVPTGTTADQPASPTIGMFRFNSETQSFEGYSGAEWGAIGGGGDEYARTIALLGL